MLIVKPGDHMNGEFTGQFTCTGRGNGGGGCNALLELTLSDLYQTYRSCMGRDETWYVTFMCPCCGMETDLANTDGYRHADLPGSIRAMNLPHAHRHARDAAKASIAAGNYRSPLEFK